MMKKVLALMLVLGMASVASAGVIDVVTVGVGDMGHAGTSTDPLVPSETIAIAIVLNANPYPGYPSYDGYFTDSVGLDLEVSGPATLDVVMTTGKVPAPDLGHHSEFGVWSQSDPLIEGNAIAKMAGGVLTGGVSSADDGGAGPGVLIWNLLIHCDGNGPVTVDLTLQDPASRYSPYMYANGLDPFPEWVPLTEGDLGDLVIHQIPEPMTIALLGLGGLFLRRRR